MTKPKNPVQKEPIFTQECYLSFPNIRHVRVFTGNIQDTRQYFSKDKLWVAEIRTGSRNEAVQQTRQKAKELTATTKIKHKYIA